METETRRAVRVFCVDDADRLLLMHWYDSDLGDTLWEPPGGGVEDGETDYEAARREWREETGLDDTVITEHYVVVHRDERWLGRHLVYDEPTFLARWPGPGPELLSRAGLMEYEDEKLIGIRWVARAEVDALTGRVVPEVADIMRRLDVPGWT